MFFLLLLSLERFPSPVLALIAHVGKKRMRFKNIHLVAFTGFFDLQGSLWDWYVVYYAIPILQVKRRVQPRRLQNSQQLGADRASTKIAEATAGRVNAEVAALTPWHAQSCILTLKLDPMPGDVGLWAQACSRNAPEAGFPRCSQPSLPDSDCPQPGSSRTRTKEKVGADLDTQYLEKLVKC